MVDRVGDDEEELKLRIGALPVTRLLLEAFRIELEARRLRLTPILELDESIEGLS